ncbi:hypothetical protein QE152_g4136 [Popillia japonica]|uniref:Uncharacterized protein n=1 Tax=Popillia japonica TaxID=7064 RepID=A0AAW1N1K4_POPJA
MAKKLTEEMVVLRTKISDLSKIKRLNCWGSELVDVSLLRRMSSVQVLSLSINKIENLEDFQYCKKLEELYIRQNNIKDLNQVYYLKNLANLKHLWLGENPCANVEGYRLAVLWVLPHLQKLDNIPVSPEEVKEAQRRGKLLSHPDDPDDCEDEEEYNSKYREYPPNEDTYSSGSSPRRHGDEYEAEEMDEYYNTRREPRVNERVSPPYSEEKSSTYNNINEDFTESNSCGELHLVASFSTNSIKDYLKGERYHINNIRQNEANDVAQPQVDVNQSKPERHTCSASYRPPFNRRPVTRNSNILSAVLCLVKELDYPSLEVVEMAVRCRMDEVGE